MRRCIKCLFVIIVIIILTGCSQNVYSKDFFYMDTVINIKLYNISKTKSEEVFFEIDNILNEYHNLTDRYNEYDNVNVYYLNNILVKDEKIKIEKKLYDVIKYGLNAYELTDGRVNITIGNVIDLWKESEKIQKLPTEEQLWQNNNSISDITLKDGYYIKNGDVKLDLGSYVKGYVTEVISDFLLNNGIKSYIINSGGNVRVGKKIYNSKFNIGIENPNNKGDIIEIVKKNDISVVTSGNYERFFSINSSQYSHIIDSKTLKPSSNMKSITVVTKDSGKADVLSTYLYQLSVEDAIKYANSTDDVEVFVIDNDNKKHYSKGFKYE